MATQEERIISVEHTTREHRHVLQSMTYELTMVKSMVIDQSRVIDKTSQDVNALADDMQKSFGQLAEYHIHTEKQIDDQFNHIKGRLDTLEGTVNQHTATLNQHTELLNLHTSVLNQHTELLNQHTATLNQHTDLLHQILERLPKTS